MATSEWGRVAEDGTVFVKTPDGERPVGSYPDATPEEALAFYTQRYDALAGDIDLLTQRLAAGSLPAEEAGKLGRKLRDQVKDAHAVGDLTALDAKLDALDASIKVAREKARAERAMAIAGSRIEKEKLVSEAEQLSTSSDWRRGVTRLAELLDQWKALPRLDRASDDELWKRFSSARTAYTRRRKAHFAEQNEQREGARVVKERLAAKAEELSTSTEWGPTAGAYRDLMRDWKAAGPAPRDVDESLWKRFRSAQDAFFSARDAENAKVDAEFAANAEVKEQLLVEAEALLPIKDLEATKKAFRDVAERWEAAGKVPRDRIRELEGRIRKVEQAIREAEDAKWRRSDPDKSARAGDMVSQLEAAIAKNEADIEKAKAAGDQRKVDKLTSELENRKAFLEMARKTSAEFTD